MVRIVLCCDDEREAPLILEQAKLALPGERVDFHAFTRLPDFFSYIGGNPYLIIIVAMNGRDGLDAVRGARRENPWASLIWFSHQEYALLSYQLQVSFFSLLPVDGGKLAAAIKACGGSG